jgi:hypothetical protein
LLGLLLAATALTGASCGKAKDGRKPTFPVSGQVQYEGKPAPGATVVFHPLGADAQAPRSYARAGPDGTFRLSTWDPDDGAPAGRYAVTVLWTEGEEGTNRLPPHYAAPETSGLEVEVKEGTNELEPFRLRRR